VFWRLFVSRPSYNEDELIALFEEPKNSKVQSLTFVGVLGHRGLPNLSNLKHLRVLELKYMVLQYIDLYYIGRLSVLRYLGLEGTGLSLLPPKILELEHLETLDLRRTDLTMLPMFKIKSMNLVSLLVDKIQLTEGLGEMKGLQELPTGYIGVDCNMLAKMVSQSKQLKMFGVRFAQVEKESDRKGLMDLLGVIANSNIQSLCLDNLSASILDSMLVCWANKRPHNLQKLQLRISI
jgi:Leucine-rich repeat (LRR) protein